jgi:hypothetical protein
MASDELNKLFKAKGLDKEKHKTIDKMFDDCVNYRKSKGKSTNLIQFTKWLNDEKPISNHSHTKQSSPLTEQDKYNIQEFMHLCKHRIPISEKIKTIIDNIKTQLKGVDHVDAREALSIINKSEEINCAESYDNLVMRAHMHQSQIN